MHVETSDPCLGANGLMIAVSFCFTDIVWSALIRTFKTFSWFGFASIYFFVEVIFVRSIGMVVLFWFHRVSVKRIYLLPYHYNLSKNTLHDIFCF